MNVQRWFVMRAYKNEKKAEELLCGEHGLEYFIPKHSVVRVYHGKKSKRLVPVIPSLVFVHACRIEINEFKQRCPFLQYVMWKTADGLDYLTVPAKQMDDFIRFATYQAENAERLRLALGEELRVLLEKIFGQQGLEFAIFGGTPCVHQKITMQISRGARILGYVKVTESKEIYGIFEHEKKILDTLHGQGMGQVPACLYCGTMKIGLHLFVQSTAKTQQSEVVHAWSEKHEQFLNDLAMHTRQKVQFEDSDFYSDLNALEERLSLLGNPEVLCKDIQEVKDRYAGREVEFSAFQADFTPWNMFVEKERLFVFDWEYARMTYPSRLDYFHFLIQTAVFEEHLTAEKIAERYASLRSTLVPIWENPDFALQCYLLSIMSIYVQREPDVRDNGVIERMQLWLELLNILNIS